MDSTQYFQQIEQAGNLPDYKQKISDAYFQPVAKGVVNSIAQNESRYLPTLYDSFKGGTGAGDMSTAAKLSDMGRKLGRLTSRVNAGANTLNFYGNTVNELANRASQDWQSGLQRQMFLAQMAQEREEAEKNRQAQLRAANIQANAQRFNLQELLDEERRRQEEANAAQAAEMEITSTDDLNTYRELVGLDKVRDPYYFERTYQPRTIDRHANVKTAPERTINLFENMFKGTNQPILDDSFITYVPQGTSYQGDFFRYLDKNGSIPRF